ncbi:hypothetical protein [Bacillus sp. Marseille-P3800]|uniref:hypothetical protein n=1 Tax=Bacillus sp. Marseille-P3800 TaxID=2014782 RepID=UPI00159BB1BF|nr:hypothetical protein [Bacillus sp. Marseille-P3800]
MITDDDIGMIENFKFIKGLTVARVNMSDFEVKNENGRIIFSGEDFEVAEFINDYHRVN